MFWLVQLLVPMGVAVVLPIAIVAIVFKSALASERNRKEIVLAVLEKNPDIDVEQLMKNLKKSEKLIKEKLLARLERGCLCCLMGMAFMVLYFFLGVQGEDLIVVVGAALIAIGIAFLVSYFVGRRMLAQEMEAEQQNMKQE
jgi:small-conductance mechanosensitive channel